MTTFPNTRPGYAYSVWVQHYGGRPPFTWTISAGALPTGLALTAQGFVTGTVDPACAVQTFNFTVQVTDGLGRVASKAFAITVEANFFIWTTNGTPINTSKLTTLGGKVADYALTRGAFGICYDGADGIWITTCTASPNNYLYKVNKNTGNVDLSIQTAYGPAGIPTGVCSDGTYVYVAVHHGAGNGALRQFALDGTPGWTTGIGDNPYFCCYDSLTGSVWVASNVSNRVDKVRVSDGVNLGNYATPNGAWAPCFDVGSGTVWVVCRTAAQIRKFNALDGANLGTYNLGTDPVFPATDGTYIYVPNRTTNNLSKVRISDGVVVATYATVTEQLGAHYDREGYLWVARWATGKVAKIRCSDGTVIGSYDTAAGCSYVCSDRVLLG